MSVQGLGGDAMGKWGWGVGMLSRGTDLFLRSVILGMGVVWKH